MGCSIPIEGSAPAGPSSLVRFRTVNGERNPWKTRFFVLVVVFFLTLGGLGLAIDQLRSNDARFIRNEQVQRFQLCFTREQTLTSKQRTAVEKRQLVAGIDRQLRKLDVPPCG